MVINIKRALFLLHSTDFLQFRNRLDSRKTEIWWGSFRAPWWFQHKM